MLHDGPSVTPELQIRMAFDAGSDVWQYDARLTYAAGDTLVFAAERYRVGPPASIDEIPFEELGAGHRESSLGPTGLGPAFRVLFRSCLVYQFHNTADTSRLRRRCYVHDGDELKEDGGNLAAVLYRWKTSEPRRYTRLVETLRQVAPYFADFHLAPDEGSVLLRWRERGTDVVFGPQQASDGTLRMMALATLLQQDHEASDGSSNVILLDEPELGLHPAALNVIGGMIRAASRRIQVIVATQSIPLLDQFHLSDVVTVNRRGRESVFARPDPERLREWLDEYSLGELWEKNVLTAGPFA